MAQNYDYSVSSIIHGSNKNPGINKTFYFVSSNVFVFGFEL